MAKRFLDTLTSEQRKQYPMSGGCVDYFPDALALISHVSWSGNEKHNPGQSLHWSRWNSTDHADCVIRHHSTRENDEHDIPLMHMAEESWRTLAMLQEAMEEYYGLDLPRGARDKLETPPAHGNMTMEDYRDLSPAWFAWKRESDCIIQAPRDAGTQLKCIVQYTDPGPPETPFRRVIETDGPFKNYEAADKYIRANPNNRLGLVSICTLNPQEE